jgi:hypothetical protein
MEVSRSKTQKMIPNLNNPETWWMKRGRAKSVCWLKENRRKVGKGENKSGPKPAQFSERKLSDLLG